MSVCFFSPSISISFVISQKWLLAISGLGHSIRFCIVLDCLNTCYILPFSILICINKVTVICAFADSVQFFVIFMCFSRVLSRLHITYKPHKYSIIELLFTKSIRRVLSYYLYRLNKWQTPYITDQVVISGDIFIYIIYHIFHL